MNTKTKPDQIAIVEYQAWLNGQAAPRCSLFDSECEHIGFPTECWLGGSDPVTIADGYCPLMFREVEGE